MLQIIELIELSRMGSATYYVNRHDGPVTVQNAAEFEPQRKHTEFDSASLALLQRDAAAISLQAKRYQACSATLSSSSSMSVTVELNFRKLASSHAADHDDLRAKHGAIRLMNSVRTKTVRCITISSTNRRKNVCILSKMQHSSNRIRNTGLLSA